MRDGIRPLHVSAAKRARRGEVMNTHPDEGRSYTVAINLRRYCDQGQWFVEKTTDPFTVREVIGPIPDELTAMLITSELLTAFNRICEQGFELASQPIEIIG